MFAWPWLKLYRVRGNSMLPALKPGDLLLGSSLVKPRIGHILVIRCTSACHSERRKTSRHIKRLKNVDSNGLWVEGDNQSASTDSHQFGYLPTDAVEAVAFYNLR